MKGLSAKNKIVLLLVVWLIFSAAMLGYFFNFLDGSNQAALDSMASDQKNLAVLQSQDQSYKQSQADLQELAQKPLQPEDFFSRDITLVKEIEILENLSQKLNVTMELTGVSGTVGALPRANTASAIVMVPYGITLNGDFISVVNFIESLEHLSFVTNVTSLSLGADDKGAVTATLNSSFYLRQ